MAYDSTRGRAILFGGSGNGRVPLGDTWEWTGSAWNRVAPLTNPPARGLLSMTYDPGRDRVVVFGGGDNANGYLNDTWEWDGTNWSQVRPAASPLARGGAALIYDTARGRTLLFGGAISNAVFGDTWTWDGSVWSQMSVVAPSSTPTTPPTTPTPTREHVRAAYLPLAFRGAPVVDIPNPVVAPNPCAHMLAGPGGSNQRSVIDLSSAHAGVRFFGVSERYWTVDQALLKAFRGATDANWPADQLEQLKFLRTYAAALEGVCAMPAAARDLGPSSVELVQDTIALVHPGSGPVVLPDGSTAVAIDLRGLPNVPGLWDALHAAVAPAIARPVLRPRSSARLHSGLTDEVNRRYSSYYNAVTLSQAAPITPTGRADLPLMILTEQRMAPEAAEFAVTLRLADRAVLVGDEVSASVAESQWSGVGANGLAWRATDFVQLGETNPPSSFAGLEVRQDECADPSSARVKRDFTTDRATAKVTIELTPTMAVAPETDLDLFVLYDRDDSGSFEEATEVVGEGNSYRANEVASVTEALPAGHFQLWALGCTVVDESVPAEMSVVVQDGYRWPDVIPADVATDDPLSNLVAAAAMWPALPAIEPVPPTRAVIRAVDSFQDFQPAETGPAEQHAALVVLHGAYRKFFRYFGVVGDGIDDRLLETLASVPADSTYTRKSLVNALRRMAEVIHDGHSWFLDYGNGGESFHLPAQLELVGGEPVVRRAAFEGINLGDALVSFNGRPAAEIYREEYARTSAATDGFRFHRATDYIAQLEGPTTLELRNPAGLTHTVVVTDTGVPVTALGPRYPRQSGWLTDIGAPSFYYVNLDQGVTTNIAQSRSAITDSMQADAMVVDMRGYPDSILQFEYAQRLIGVPFKGGVFRWKVFDGPNRTSDYEIQNTFNPLRDPHYDGPIALLVGPSTFSAAENFALMLHGAHRATVVGQRSAGTNGTITGIQLPGGFAVSFTGMETLYQDGSAFQGVGIVPDIDVAPSAADLRDGIDRELVTAIGYLKGH